MRLYTKNKAFCSLFLNRFALALQLETIINGSLNFAKVAICKL